MTRLYQFASRFCGSGAALCAMLALLAASPSARADDPLTCEQCCAEYTGYQHQQCMYNCEQGYGECGALVSCGAKGANGCTALMEVDCASQGTTCATIHGGICGCKWDIPVHGSPYCGCFPD